ncbi:MAG TPA: hypothetical protein VGC68_00585 [Enterovirga sp.]|jgi:hypothetical protein|nr:hypothetical protein [Enterovirga sp.]
MLRSARHLGLFLVTAATFATSGKAPGAVQLRTREVETFIMAEGKTGRDLKAKSAWIERGRA